MKNLIVLIVIALSAIGIKRGSDVKKAPEYTGVDKKVEVLLSEYIDLAHERHIKFTKMVTIGFKTINEGRVVGLCTYSRRFREIDLDTAYWDRATETERRTLAWHEMSHCYCGRGHDFGEDMNYPEVMRTKIEKIINMFSFKQAEDPKPGFYIDGCPKSLMFPTVVSDKCVDQHYNEYVNELFERCEPY